MSHDPDRRRLAAASAALIAAAGWGLPRLAHAAIPSGDNPDTSPMWLKVRASLFAQRPIAEATDAQLVLDAPTRAEDAAVVPVAMRSRLPQTGAQAVSKLYLVIDSNPSPISAIFSFTPQSGRAEVETRVRVDEYTFVRAVAETADGKLWMRTRFVKASGGCSAPPGKDPQAALAAMGRMKLRVEGNAVLRQPTLAQLMISHPNDSGMVMDQLSRQFTPARFVRTVNVAYRDQPVLAADLDFSISENPNLRFFFLPDGPGRLTAEVTDTQQATWKTSLDVTPVAA